MRPLHLLATGFILFCTCVAWLVLGQTLVHRTSQSGNALQDEVSDVWGPPLTQVHPTAFFLSPNSPGGKARVVPETSKIEVKLLSDPKMRGLLWHRTYDVAFAAEYQLVNPTKVPQTIYVQFPLPDDATALKDVVFDLPGATNDGPAAGGGDAGMTRAVVVEAGGKVVMKVAYRTRGMDTWKYAFGAVPRVRGFRMVMTTDFADIDIPSGTGSPTERVFDGKGWNLVWNYPDVIAAPDIGMDMPKVLNAGPVASRMTFFAPVSLLFFFSVVLLVGLRRGIALHPMHFFFVAAGFFAFHLVFAYLVDLLPIHPSFAIAAAVSVLLVSGYLRAVGGKKLWAVAVPAQLTYLVVFSYSFFFDGLTGITLTVVAVLTLAVLMFLTAKFDWSSAFTGTKAKPAG